MRPSEDNNSHPFLITLVASIALSYLSFTGITFIGGKPVDMFNELRKPIDTTTLQSREAFVDSLNKLLKNKPAKFTAQIEKKDTAMLESFFNALRNLPLARNKVRVAWFGDSMIEGDLVTNDFRKMMQNEFGGNGVGYVGITSTTAPFRTSISHTFSGWKTYSFTNAPPRNIQLGIAGFTHINQGEAKVHYGATKEYKAFGDVRLLFANSRYGSIHVQADTSEFDIFLDSISGPATVAVWDSFPCKKLSLQFNDTKAEYYGMYFDNGPGVYVDNFSFRGNSGIPLSSLSEYSLQKIAATQNYELVILNYGLNVVAHNQKNYDWYTMGFKKTLTHVRKSFPNATIVMMSVGDRSFRNNGVYETEPDIPKFVAIQKKLAADEGIVFWNLYEAMGGYNSMKRWVEEKPRLANYDYTHPNFDGAKKIATLFFEYLQTQYTAFLAAQPLGRDSLLQTQR